ncbi:WD40/YVTN/BNR-like repeat-containing protein [Acidicapsa ligni]|uniref:WD40/YVTN/BNR-like repeat-containing protein n=1 Tax=Acidicapsa ligni TaxID=542300 RepID=UPI0021E03A2B|nr:hypothetical protein [Acidicapsa ligni]
MKKKSLLVCYLLTLVGCMAVFSQATPAITRPVGFQWLGNLPVDELYSTKAMRIDGNRGAIIKEQVTLTSTDGGRSWSQLKKASSVDVSSAWLTPLLHSLRLSSDSLLVNNAPGAATRVIPLQEENVSYLSTASSETLQQMFLVGGRSVATTKQELAELPQYARDPTTAEARMITPMISVSSDYGKTWQAMGLEKAVGYLDSVKAIGSDELAWGPYSVYASTDSGKSWKLMKMDTPDGEEDAYPISGAIVADRVYVSLKNGRLLSGQIGGESLKPVARPPSAIGQLTFTGQCTGFGIAPSTTNDEDVLMETKDSGETWFPILRAKKIVALTSYGSEIFGATQNRAFRFQSEDKLSNESCGNRTQ